MKGIDISEHQGEINWDAVRGVDFVMLRAGYSQGNIDKQFVRNIGACNRLGIPCGVYWFSYAYTEDMARREAEHCLKAVAPYKLALPVAFDWEYESCNWAVKQGVKPTRALATAMCHAFCGTVKAAGLTPMNYTNPDYLNQFYDETTLSYPLWLAQWATAITYQNPKADIWLWQYGLASVTGFSREVDGNVGYINLEEDTSMENADARYEAFKAHMELYLAELAAQEPGGWSETERNWAVAQGIIQGDDRGRLRWKSPITREEYAVTEYRQATTDTFS